MLKTCCADPFFCESIFNCISDFSTYVTTNFVNDLTEFFHCKKQTLNFCKLIQMITIRPDQIIPALLPFCMKILEEASLVMLHVTLISRNFKIRESAKNSAIFCGCKSMSYGNSKCKCWNKYVLRLPTKFRFQAL